MPSRKRQHGGLGLGKATYPPTVPGLQPMPAISLLTYAMGR
jgi:hypothetical protein